MHPSTHNGNSKRRSHLSLQADAGASFEPAVWYSRLPSVAVATDAPNCDRLTNYSRDFSCADPTIIARELSPRTVLYVPPKFPTISRLPRRNFHLLSRLSTRLSNTIDIVVNRDKGMNEEIG